MPMELELVGPAINQKPTSLMRRQLMILKENRRRLAPGEVNQPSPIEAAKPQRLVLVNLLAYRTSLHKTPHPTSYTRKRGAEKFLTNLCF